VNRLYKLALLLVLIAIAFWGCGKLFEQSFSKKEDLNRYAAYLSKMSPHLVGHFPEQISDETTARVAFSSGQLQANMFLQLRIKLDDDSIADIQNLAKAKSIAEYNGGLMFDHYNDDQLNNFPTASFHTNYHADDYDGSGFPQHFTLYVFSATQKNMDWETTGIAISTETNTVVYWAEDD